MSPSLLPPGSECSDVARAMGHETMPRGSWPIDWAMVWSWYGDGVVMVVYRSQDRNLAQEREWGGWCVGVVLKLDYTFIHTWYAKCIGNPSLIGSFDYIQHASNFHKAMLIGWERPVQIVLINFGTQVLLRSIAPRSLTVEGFVPTLEFGDLIFKLFWMNATFDSANMVM